MHWLQKANLNREQNNLRTIKIKRWKNYQNLVNGLDFKSWAFRGQSEAKWPLWTSLARYLRNTGVHKKTWQRQEERALRIFQRKAHLFLEHIPDLSETGIYMRAILLSFDKKPQCDSLKEARWGSQHRQNRRIHPIVFKLHRSQKRPLIRREIHE
jgi:hypothetical protein